jgi:hypothetical protein
LVCYTWRKGYDFSSLEWILRSEAVGRESEVVACTTWCGSYESFQDWIDDTNISLGK